MRRELERIEIPYEHEARERTLAVLRAAHAGREPVLRGRGRAPVLIALAAAGAVAAALTSPGRAVLDEVRDAVTPVRVERTEPALVSLPAPGRLLVVSDERGGVWVVQRDGSKRRLGDYDDARWSPFGRFVVASRRNELLALTPEGEERWSLARRDVRDAAWGGSRTDTRIAYHARSGLRVVGGNGRGDRLLAPAESGPLAWRPRSAHQLAYASASEIRLQSVDDGRVVWRVPAGAHPGAARGLSWSADGERLAVVFPDGLVVLDGRGREVRRLVLRDEVLVAASFAPVGRLIAVLVRDRGDVGPASRFEVRVVGADRAERSRRVFSGQGAFGGLAWSPDERWLLVAWRSARQWLFVDARSGRVRAVANVDEQFPRPDDRPPRLLVSDRWCCAP